MSTTHINDIRPIIGYQDNMAINAVGSYSKIYELQLPEIYSLSKEDYQECCRLWESFFSIIPQYTIIQKLDIFYHRKYTLKIQDNDILSTGYKLKFNEKQILDHKCILSISKGSSAIRNQKSSSSSIFNASLIPKEFRQDKYFNEFISATNRIEALCKDSKLFKLKLLKKEEIENITESYENLNFTNSNYSSDIYQDKSKSMIGNKHISVLAINSLSCLPNEFDNYYKEKKLSTEYSSVEMSLFHPIGLGFGQEHIVNQTFIKESKEYLLSNMEKNDRMNIVFGKKDISENQNVIESNAFKDEMSNGCVPVRVHSNVLIWDRNIDRLNAKEDTLNAKFSRIGFKPNVAFNESMALYWAGYPGNGIDIGYTDQTFLMLDYQVSALNIYETLAKDDISSFGIKVSERVNGIPIHLDISDLPKDKGITDNRNKLIIGPSGSGKSFTTNHILDSYLRTSAHIVAVDIGDSYERLCMLHKGKYFRYEEDNPLSFNPFYIKKEDRTIDRIDTVLELIFTLWKKDPEIHVDEKVIILTGIKKYYEYIDNNDAGVFMCFNSLYEFLKEDYFPSLEIEIQKLINTSSLFNVLSMFYKGGVYDHLLNSKENIDLINEQFIVFELDNIKDNATLFPIVALMIMDTFITKMTKLEGVRKVILIEEAWKAISKAGMASFIKYLYKTVRKFFGEAILVTQDIDDIVGNEFLKESLRKNCAAKILLDQRVNAADFDKTQKLLSINNKEKNKILSMNLNNIPGEKYKEVYIGLGNQGAVYGINLSLEQYATYTTEKLEKEQIMKYFQEHNDMEIAIKLFADDLRASA